MFWLLVLGPGACVVVVALMVFAWHLEQFVRGNRSHRCL